MKAAINLALASAVGVLTVISVFSFSIAYQSHAVVKGFQERNIIESVNQMEFIEMGMDQSMLYSVYQAGYDVSKYGTYKNGEYDTFGKCDTASIDPKLPDRIPKDLPYWRIFGTTCFDTTGFPVTPSEIERNVITQLEKEVPGRFTEYTDAIKTEYDISIPNYKSAVQLSDSYTTVTLTTDDGEINFDSEKLKLSDALSGITKTVSLPLKRLIDYGITNLVVLANSFSEKIEEAHQAMSGITVQNRVDADISSVNSDFVDGSLNNGELTDRGTKNCKSTEYKICVDPGVTSDFTYTYPKKRELLPTNCEAKFRLMSSSNIDNLDYVSGNIDIAIKPKFIETKVNIGDEATCTPTNEANSASCDCIKWVCPAPTQVKIGDATEIRTVGDFEVGTDATAPSIDCTTCRGIDINDCIQFTAPNVCPQGYQLRDVNDDGDFDRNECVQVTNRCPASNPNFFDGKCYKVVQCESDSACNLQTGCSKPSEDSSIFCWHNPIDPQTCPDDTTEHDGECWSKEQRDMQCPSGTDEYQTTGRCYDIPSCPSGSTYSAANDRCEPNRSEPTCALHRTLYTKSCDYNYQANATVLVNLKDNENSYQNKYPVYDTGEDRSNLQNLELNFYVLSKN